MRKLTFLFILVFIANSVISQDTTIVAKSPNFYKPDKGNFGISFNPKADITDLRLRSFSDDFGNNSLFLRYYALDDVAVRVGFGLTTINEKNSTVDSVGTSLVEMDSIYSRTDIYLAPGIEKHFTATPRLDPYAGADISFGKVGKARMNSITQVTDTSGTSSGTSKLEIDATQDGGFLFGLKLITGFNYFITQKLSIGAEYTWGYNVVRTGGNWAEVTTNTPVNGNPTTNREEGTMLSTISTIGVNSTAGITLSYFFGKSK